MNTDLYGAIMPRPLSLFEREQRAKELREEASKLILEAERIEAGILSDKEKIIKIVEEMYPLKDIR